MNRPIVLSGVYAAAMAFLLVGVGHAEAAVLFTGLGYLPGGFTGSFAYDATADGSVVVGHGMIIKSPGYSPRRRPVGPVAEAWSAWATCPGAASIAGPMACQPTGRWSWEQAPGRQAPWRSVGPVVQAWSAWAT